MPEAAAILARLDAIMVELAALRAAVAGAEADLSRGARQPADLADGNLIDSFAAQEKIGHPADSIRKWARESAGTEQAIGVMRGGRWLIDPRALRQRLNGK